MPVVLCSLSLRPSAMIFICERRFFYARKDYPDILGFLYDTRFVYFRTVFLFGILGRKVTLMQFVLQCSHILLRKHGTFIEHKLTILNRRLRYYF